MKKNEAIVIRNRGGKILEIKIICHEQKNNSRFKTDNVVEGAMEVKNIPDKYHDFLTWVDKSGRLPELEKLIQIIVK